MKKRKKVLIVIKSLDGGTGTFLLQILKLKSFFDFSVVALEKPKYRNLDKRHKIHYISMNRYITFPLILTFFGEFLYFLYYKNKISPDIIFSIDTHCNMLTALGKFVSTHPQKIILTNHNNVSAVFQAKLFIWQKYVIQKLGTYLFATANEIVCVSKGSANDVVKLFSLKKSPLVIHYGINLSQAKILGKKDIGKDKRYFSPSPTILSIGRFEPQKDFLTLIHAFAKVKKIIHTASLILIGNGKEKVKIQKLINQLHLSQSIHLLGWRKNSYQYLRYASLFVLSSRYEGFPYILLEALSQKTPILATNTPYGPEELLENGLYGKLTPVGNIQKMANEILALLQNKEIYTSLIKKSQKRSKVFTEEKMLARYKVIFQTI
jgi:glycosyltransferase involved in cell wall biosynthesis